MSTKKKLIISSIFIIIFLYALYFLLLRLPLINDCRKDIANGDIWDPKTVQNYPNNIVKFERMGGVTWEQCQKINNVVKYPFYYTWIMI